jgi:hypothetical protein
MGTVWLMWMVPAAASLKLYSPIAFTRCVGTPLLGLQFVA